MVCLRNICINTLHKGGNDDDNDDDDDDDDYDDDDNNNNNNNRDNCNHLRIYLSNVPGKHDVKELEKTDVVYPAHTYLFYISVQLYYICKSKIILLHSTFNC